MEFTTIAELYSELPRLYGNNPCLAYRKKKNWVTMDTAEVMDTVDALAAGLGQLGIAKGNHISLLSNTTRFWTIIDFAIAVSGGVNVPVYPTLTPEQTEHIILHSESKIVFLESPVRYKKMKDFFSAHPQLHCVLINNPSGGFEKNDRVMTLDDLIAAGKEALKKQGPGYIEKLIKSITPEDMASLLYTSGTTGEPKGVMLTHRNIMSNVTAGGKRLLMDEFDRSLVFLPLSHAYARTCNYIMLQSGITLYFAQNLGTIARDIQETKPQFLVGVTRIYEKVYEGVEETAREGGAFSLSVFEWARNTAVKMSKTKSQGRAVSPFLRIQYALADLLVYRKIKEKLGGNINFIQSGSSATLEEIAHFYHGIGIGYVEGYGLTETSPIITAHSRSEFQVGNVGTVIDGVDIKLAPDGELLVKGPNVMKGYYKDPEATRDSFTEDGWLLTGDICSLDERGYLTIIERKKDLMKTTAGKYVVPQKIEMLAKQNRYIEEFIVIAEMKLYPAALIVPDIDRVRDYLKSRNIACDNGTDLLTHESVQKLFKTIIEEEINIHLANHEQIVRFRLIDKPLSIENGTMTPTLKVRRQAINEMFEKEISEMYSS